MNWRFIYLVAPTLLFSSPQAERWLKIHPGPVEVKLASTFRFTLDSMGLDPKNISWEVLEKGVGGTVQQNGEYLAPLYPGDYHLKVTYDLDPSLTSTVQVKVGLSGKVIKHSAFRINDNSSMNISLDILIFSDSSIQFTSMTTLASGNMETMEGLEVEYMSDGGPAIKVPASFDGPVGGDLAPGVTSASSPAEVNQLHEYPKGFYKIHSTIPTSKAMKAVRVFYMGQLIIDKKMEKSVAPIIYDWRSMERQ